MRLGVVFGVACESLALEQALVEVLVRLVVRYGSLLRLAIGRRLVLAFWHNDESRTTAFGVRCGMRRAELEINFGGRKLLRCASLTPPSLDRYR